MKNMIKSVDVKDSEIIAKCGKLARENKANKVYPMSVAEGFQTGEIFVDDVIQPKAAFFWHYCGFGYISGEPDNEFLGEISGLMSAKDKGRRLVLILNEQEIIRFFRDKDVSINTRVEYSYTGTVSKPVNYDSDRFQIKPVDSDNIFEIRGRIVPSFSWDSNEHFLEKGFGYAAFEGDDFCGVAFSSAVSSEEVDIGVETAEKYRGNGIASALSATMRDHIIRIGKKPVWAHAGSNLGSMHTALGLGFEEVRRNTVIIQEDKG